MSISADSQKQQQLQQQQEEYGSAPVSSESRTATALADQDQRKTLKFGFSSKGSASKVCPTVSFDYVYAIFFFQDFGKEPVMNLMVLGHAYIIYSLLSLHTDL